ncbi:hypothetical protein ACVW16_000228 [Bradyrhizobium sp. USDA 4474]
MLRDPHTVLIFMGILAGFALLLWLLTRTWPIMLALGG